MHQKTCGLQPLRHSESMIFIYEFMVTNSCVMKSSMNFYIVNLHTNSECIIREFIHELLYEISGDAHCLRTGQHPQAAAPLNFQEEDWPNPNTDGSQGLPNPNASSM